MEEAIEKPLITEEQGIQFMWERKYHLEIGGINHLSPTFIHPDFLINGLTVGAVPVTAGIIMDFDVPAIGTEADITAQRAAFAPYDGYGGFLLKDGREVSGGVIAPPKTENLLDLTLCHKYLPFYQEDL